MKKIVLCMLPYWTPLIPPQGIGCLKSYLEQNGFKVLGIDYNVDEQIRSIYNKYFDEIKKSVPEEKWGNFYNVGHDVLQNHMMAQIQYTDEDRYINLVKEIVCHTFYTRIDTKTTIFLNNQLKCLYEYLEKRIKEVVDQEVPDVIGFSLFKTNIPTAVYAAKVIKDSNPNIKVVVGGGAFADSHEINSPNFDELLKVSKGYIDTFFVASQGEILFRKYMEGELKEGQRVYTTEDISGETIGFKDMGIADLSDFELSKYPYVAATASASCPNQCSFCNASKYMGKYREKNADQTVKEMLEIYNKYNIQLFFLTDSLLNGVVTNLAKEFIKADKKLYYDCYFRVDTPSGDINNTLLWRRGGLYRTRLGVESGSQKILDLMHKNITVDQTRASLSALAKAGIKTTTYWVIGHPDETEEDFQMTLDLLEELKDYIWQAECNPFYYHYSGQFDSDGWAQHRMLLYPADAKDMLVFDTWTLDIEPLREERYNRMCRFVEHCKRLGIPNPYSAEEIFEADKRWKKLHKNAVPPVLDFKNFGSYIDDTDTIVNFKTAEVEQNKDMFNFN